MKLINEPHSTCFVFTAPPSNNSTIQYIAMALYVTNLLYNYTLRLTCVKSDSVHAKQNQSKAVLRMSHILLKRRKRWWRNDGRKKTAWIVWPLIWIVFIFLAFSMADTGISCVCVCHFLMLLSSSCESIELTLITFANAWKQRTFINSC